MGWDTEIVILAEHVKNRKEASDLAKGIVEKDARSYGPVSCFFKHSGALFFHYERRKYAPYWIIQDLSKTFPEVNFTLLASCPDFLGGPAGIIRISKGEILDSYGIGEGNHSTMRAAIIDNPLNFIPLIYDWYRFNGPEDILRMQHIEEYPRGWCDENYVDKLIPIADTVELSGKVATDYANRGDYDWFELNQSIP